MERDGFACQACGNEKKTLNVHHYKYHGMPWEAPDNHLITLCEDDHHAEEQAKGCIASFIKDLNITRGILYLDVFDMLYGIKERLDNNPGDTRKDIMRRICKSLK